MFRFKQFTIHQDRTAMKVGTDACVLGAYVDVRGNRILDIGTGTGLLSLMAAQRNPMACIDAVELDAEAAGQATENVGNSPFSERVRVVHERIQTFAAQIDPVPYDRILTNPPFYTNHLTSPDMAANRALHTGDLPLSALLDAVVRLLKSDGQWWVMLPAYEAGQLEKLAQAAGLRPFQQLHIRHNAQKPVLRVITGFGYGPAISVVAQTLEIYQMQPSPAGKQLYTEAFAALLKPFYLIF